MTCVARPHDRQELHLDVFTHRRGKGPGRLVYIEVCRPTTFGAHEGEDEDKGYTGHGETGDVLTMGCKRGRRNDATIHNKKYRSVKNDTL